MVPVDMAKAPEKPAEMTPVEAPAAPAADTNSPTTTSDKPDSRRSQDTTSAPAPVATESGTTPAVSMSSPPEPYQAPTPDEAAADAGKTDSANADGTKPDDARPDDARPDGNKPDGSLTQNATSDEPAQPAPIATDTDMSPTGSMSQSPPEPYEAPTPDEAAAAAEKN